jgi:hypothetical protein
MAKSSVKKKIIKHGGGWVLVLILVVHAILSTLGSPQIWRGPWQIVMSYCHFIEGHAWCPIWIPIDVKMVCHIILPFHWNPQMTSQMRSHLDTYQCQNGLSCHITISLKPTNDIPNEIPFGDCTYWSKTIFHVILSFHWNPQMTSQMKSYLEIVPIDLKPFVMSYSHFIETHKWHPKWGPIRRLYLSI